MHMVNYTPVTPNGYLTASMVICKKTGNRRRDFEVPQEAL